jgi:hypothetical protein
MHTKRRRAIKYNLVGDGANSSITAFIQGEMYTANTNHPNWGAIVAGVVADDDSVVRLFDPSLAVASRFERLTDRVSIANGRVYFDGDHVDNSVTEQILRFLEEDEDFMPLVNFMEKVAQNPESHSREQLFGWVKARPSITITEDGDLVAYKGLYSEEDEDGTLYKSWHSGTAIVNGELFEDQQIPQRIGDTVEMPRSQVEFNPAQGCSTGLHAGTFDYARSYGNSRVKVAINPRDVVSVPTEHNEAKIRVCRYVVIDEAAEEIQAPLYKVSDYANVVGENDEDDDPYCQNCGANDHFDDECPEYDEEDDEDYSSAYGPQYGF